MFSPRCDVGRGDSNVDKPPRLLRGLCKGHPLAPGKRQLVQPSKDGMQNVDVAQLSKLLRPTSLLGGDLFSFVHPSVSSKAYSWPSFLPLSKPSVSPRSASHLRAFPGASWATRVTHFFLFVGLHLDSRNLTFCRPCLIS